MLKHFLWSLLGLADLDPLDSVDSPSVILAYFLYGVFLIMAVILLINMMIALLSNTYQQVAVRIFTPSVDSPPFLHEFLRFRLFSCSCDLTYCTLIRKCFWLSVTYSLR